MSFTRVKVMLVGKRPTCDIIDRADRIVSIRRTQEGHHIGYLFWRLEISQGDRRFCLLPNFFRGPALKLRYPNLV